MIGKSPSGALSPYYYKGGYFHGIHYGDYENNAAALFDMMKKEEEFILKSPERKRILMDFYHTEMTPQVLSRIVEQVSALDTRIFKLAIATDKQSLRQIRRAIRSAGIIDTGRCYFGTDMEEDKTWLVNDGF